MSCGLERAAERVSHEFLGQSLHELLGPREQRARAARPGPVTGVPSTSTPDASIGAPASRSIGAPAADRVEILEREAERVDDAVARVARRIRAVRFEPRAHRARGFAFDVLDERLDVRRRRLRRRAEHVLEQPCAAQHRRRAVRVRRREQHAALAEQAQAVLVGELDAAEALAANVVDAVVARERLVRRTCGSPSSRSSTLRSARKMLSTNSVRLGDEVLRGSAGRRRRTRTDRARGRRARPSSAIGTRSSTRASRRAGRRACAATCCSSTAGSLQPVARPRARAARRRGSCSIRRTRAATRARRCSRDSSRRRVAPSGAGSKRYRNFGCASTPDSAYLTPSSKPPAVVTRVVEPHEARQVVGRECAAKRFARERRRRSARAHGRLVGAAPRVAVKILSRLGVLAQARGRDGPEDLDAIQRQHACPGRRPARARRDADRIPRTSGAGTSRRAGARPRWP